MSEQTREEWLAERRKVIGASDIATMLGINPFQTPWELWADKTGRLEGDTGDAATRAGNLYENAVLDHAEQKLGALERQVRIAAESYPIVATCDAIIKSTGQPVEAKTTGLVGPVYGEWGEELTDQIPEQYLVQVQAQLLCTKAEIGFLFALIAGRGTCEFQIERSDKICTYLGEMAATWWETHVVRDTPPLIDQPPAYGVVQRLKRQPGKRIKLTDEQAMLVAKREHYSAAESDAKKKKDEFSSLIGLALEDAEEAELPDGRLLTFYETKRAGYTVQPTSYRSIRIKKAK